MHEESLLHKGSFFHKSRKEKNKVIKKTEKYFEVKI